MTTAAESAPGTPNALKQYVQSLLQPGDQVTNVGVTWDTYSCHSKFEVYGFYREASSGFEQRLYLNTDEVLAAIVASLLGLTGEAGK